MCEKAVEKVPHSLKFVPDQYKTQKMCEKAVENKSENLEFVPDQYKIQRMCEKAVENESENLEFVPYQYKTQRMCERTIEKKSWSLEYFPDWFVTQQQIKIWHDDDEYCNDDEITEWYDSYKKTKGSKSLNSRRALTYCLAPIKALGLVYVRR